MLSGAVVCVLTFNPHLYASHIMAFFYLSGRELPVYMFALETVQLGSASFKPIEVKNNIPLEAF